MADGSPGGRPAEPYAANTRAGTAPGAGGLLLGVLTVTPAPERNGNDLLRSIERVPEIVDVTPIGDALQLHAEVDSITRLQQIAEQFRRQVGVVAVTIHVLNADPKPAAHADPPRTQRSAP